MTEAAEQYSVQGFRFNEKYLSQIPALQQLINLSYDYLSPEQALGERGGKTGNFILEEILREQLKRINRIHYKGQEYLFSEENIQSAIEKLKTVKFDGLQKTNEGMYDLLTLGTAMMQSVEGDNKSFNLNYIDWEHWEQNCFHVTAEFSVERAGHNETVRPDIILFVNGLPLVVMECKSPNIELQEAVSQSIRNQSPAYIPRFFSFTQIVLAINKNAAKYATAGTSAKFWSVWKELQDKDATVSQSVNTRLNKVQKDKLFSGEFTIARSFFDALEQEGDRMVTEQDRMVYSLCHPHRLLELAYKFTVVENGTKKIARYQQYFVIQFTLERVKRLDSEERRKGGVIWHTQGSGKSLTMVMLARNLALDPDIQNPRIVLVTDRDDLDKQLGNTFTACGLAPHRATSGRHLLELVSEQQAGIVTTLIHKFDKAMNVKKYQDESNNIFMLVDESHRTNFGMFASRMRQMFPRACYLGFTGTPLLKKEKNNFTKFGDLIEPHYSITQAVEDEAVVPLLYEGRHVEMEQNKQAIDLWFERHTKGLNKQQQADLKKKYARAEMLNRADQVVYMRAFDISEHYRANWQGTGFKAQLVAPLREIALKYHQYLNEIGYVSSEVVISAPDEREGFEETDDESTDEVVKFWKKMMLRYGNKDEYEKQIINQFKHGEEPEILIVVSKLLTGFDAPRNAVLYLCNTLREHTLLQAIARVNRIYENKEFGYIVDYVSVLGELDKALTMYSAFDGFDEADIEGSLIAISEEVARLPQRYSDLWDVFKEVKNSHDEEAYEVLLADDALREDFYQYLSEFSKTLALALSSEQFISTVDDNKLQEYKTDMKRFHQLKAAVKLRYADAIDYRDYEPKIKKLLDTHIQANEAIQLNEPVNIFDEQTFNQIKEDRGIYKNKTKAAKADAIAHSLKKSITEKMGEDPAFYKKFSKLIEEAIEAFREQRITDLEFLNRVKDYRNKVVNRQHDDLPQQLQGNEDAMAFYGILQPYFNSDGLDEPQREKMTASAALAIHGIIKYHWKVQFWDDFDEQKKAMNEIDDFLYDEVKEKFHIDLSLEQMDEIISQSMRLARNRMS